MSVLQRFSNLKMFAGTCWYGVCSPVGGSVTTFNGVILAVYKIMGQLQMWMIVLSIAIMLYGAFLYVTAAGDDSKINAATKTVVSAVVALIIFYVVYFVLKFIAEVVLGINIPI